MLAKLGLPPKPSLKENEWVVDASSCQGCQSQFSMMTRKHHCRRCGGIFCSTCTQQRMYLRGQGDSPVRICGPCKKIEDEKRPYKNKHVRGALPAPKIEDKVLDMILNADGKRALAEHDLVKSTLVNMQNAITSDSSSSALLIEDGTKDDTPTPSSVDSLAHAMEDNGAFSPQELRKQAEEEKKKYVVLKREGKSSDALLAFKRGKELEREANALEIQIRKARRMASSTRSVNTQRPTDEQPDRAQPSKRQNKNKDDLASELKELGWSDADLHEEKKPATVEGELRDILGEIQSKSAPGKGRHTLDRSQVLAHKRNALQLKREGKLLEAKDELKKAKILEKQLEEQELLGQDEDESDDELAALIHGMDDGNEEDISMDIPQDMSLTDLPDLGVDDVAVLDGNFNVTEDDMNDPEIAAALQSFGWEEEPYQETAVPEEAMLNRESLTKEVLALKQEAVRQKRAGNTAEAMALLRRAKQLERDFESSEDQGDSSHMRTGAQHSVRDVGLDFTSPFEKAEALEMKPNKKSRSEIQRELLGLKRKALALKREGNIEEADDILRNCKALEEQLNALDNAPQKPPAKENDLMRKSKLDFKQPIDVDPLMYEVVDVSEQDMHDPSLLSDLHVLGWEDEGDKTRNVKPEARVKPLKSRAEIQKELLMIKRKALALRREGKLEEANAELRNAEVLQAQLEESNASQNKPSEDLSVKKSLGLADKNYRVAETIGLSKEEVDISDHDSKDPALLSVLQSLGWKDEDEGAEPVASPIESSNNSGHPDMQKGAIPRGHKSRAQIQKELLQIKRKSLALRREGKLEEAQAELKKAEVLEAQMAEMDASLQKPSTGSQLPPQDFTYDDIRNHAERDSEEVTLDQVPSLRNRSSNSTVVKPLIDFGQDDLADVLVGTSKHPAKISQVDHLLGLDLKNDEGHTSDRPVQNILLQDGEASWYTQDPLLQVPLFAARAMTHTEDLSNVYDPLLHVTPVASFKAQSGRSNAGTVQDMKGHGANPNSESISAATSMEESNLDNRQQEIVLQKRKALALKREGKLAEAKEALRRAKELEKAMLADAGNITGQDTETSTAREPQTPQTPLLRPTSEIMSKDPAPAPSEKKKSPTQKISPRDRYKIQQECLGHKRQAMKLRREGHTEEAEAELAVARSLESQLEESNSHEDEDEDDTEATAGVSVEDFIDPQLAALLQSIGMSPMTNPTAKEKKDAKLKVSPTQETKMEKPQIVEKQDSKAKAVTKASNPERVKLEEQIKAEKVQALTMKREGKQSEALEALRRAKLLEKKLASLP